MQSETLRSQLQSAWKQVKEAKAQAKQGKESLRFAGLSPSKRQIMRSNVEREIMETVDGLRSTLERINNLKTVVDPDKTGLMPRTFATKSGRSVAYSPRNGYATPYARLAWEWNQKWKQLQQAKAKLGALKEAQS